VLSSYRLALLYIFFSGLPTFLCTSGHEVSCFGSVGRCDLQAGKEAGSSWFLVQPTGVPCFAACWELVHMTGRSRENRAALTAVALWTDILNVSESNLFLRETQTEVC